LLLRRPYLTRAFLRAATDEATTHRNLVHHRGADQRRIATRIERRGHLDDVTADQVQPCRRRSMICASSTVMPPHSGVPVPGA